MNEILDLYRGGGTLFELLQLQQLYRLVNPASDYTALRWDLHLESVTQTVRDKTQHLEPLGDCPLFDARVKHCLGHRFHVKIPPQKAWGVHFTPRKLFTPRTVLIWIMSCGWSPTWITPKVTPQCGRPEIVSALIYISTWAILYMRGPLQCLWGVNLSWQNLSL